MPPTHYFTDGIDTDWYVFTDNLGRYLVMLCKDEGPLRAVALYDTYSEVTDLYNTVKEIHPKARWDH